MAALGTFASPYIANAQAKTATCLWVQGFVKEEDEAFKNLVAAYEKALPGGAERIFRMAEREQEHANLVERRSLNAEIFLSVLGQILGLIGLLVIVGAGAWAVWLGYVTAGVGLIAASSLAAVVPHFVRGRSILFGFPVQPPAQPPPTRKNAGPKPKRR